MSKVQVLDSRMAPFSVTLPYCVGKHIILLLLGFYNITINVVACKDGGNSSECTYYSRCCNTTIWNIFYMFFVEHFNPKSI